MGYIDVFIPLAFGVMAISIPQILIKENDAKLERKIVIIRRIGYGLIAVAILYGMIKYFS